MLPAKDELSHYITSVDGPNDQERAVLAEMAAAMSPAQATAWMALIMAAEEAGEQRILDLAPEPADTPTVAIQADPMPGNRTYRYGAGH